MANLTINLPNRPKDDLIEIVGLGVFKNGHTYKVDELKEDRVYGSAEGGRLNEDPPVKVEPPSRDDRIAELLELSDADLDELADSYKVTFDANVTKEDKAAALVDSLDKEGSN